jgi:hypothetical protein
MTLPPCSEGLAWQEHPLNPWLARFWSYEVSESSNSNYHVKLSEALAASIPPASVSLISSS